MAKIVGAFGVSHGPLLTTPPDQWELRANFDRRNPRHVYRGAFYDYPSLLVARGPGFADQIEISVKTKRYEACQAAVAEVARRYAACGANAAIILGNDQHEIFSDSFTPAFMVYAGREIPNIHPNKDETERLSKMALAVALPGHVPPHDTVYVGAPAVAEAIVDELIAREFDIAISYELPANNGRRHGIPHAYGFIFRRIMNDNPPPTVPIFMNVDTTRNQPRLKRMMNFGHAIKGAIDALPDDLNVAIFTSGGLTHYTVDED